MISVIVPTNRVGGLDVLVEGLRLQTYRDFELIVVDCLWNRRADAVAEKLENQPFRVLHVPPRENLFPTSCYQRCVNTGLVHARGEIVYFTCDYTFILPDCLERHASFHAQNPGPAALVGPFSQLEHPAVHKGFPGKFGPEWNQKWPSEEARAAGMNQYAKDYLSALEAQKLDAFMWSAYQSEFSEHHIADLGVMNVSSYISLPSGPSIPGVCNLKNDSFKLESLLTINGFDEDFDGAHFCQDYEMAERAGASGVKFNLDRDALVFILDMHDYMTIRASERSERANFKLFQQKQGKIVAANPSFNLREMRTNQ
jgi:glycosyltransferase involved in cell wall biosynthesis